MARAGSLYTTPATGATAQGTLTVLDPADGHLVREVPVGLHPNALLASPDGRYVYVANGNSNTVTMLAASSLTIAETIPVQLMPGLAGFGVDSPNALALDAAGTTLYVANGLDNAVAVVRLGQRTAGAEATEASRLQGFIPSASASPPCFSTWSTSSRKTALTTRCSATCPRGGVRRRCAYLATA